MPLIDAVEIYSALCTVTEDDGFVKRIPDVDKDNQPIKLDIKDVRRAIVTAHKINPIHAAGAYYCHECQHWQRNSDIHLDHGLCSLSGMPKHENGFCDDGQMQEEANE